MKYMKLGSKPDIFWSNHDVTTVATELASDFTIQVHDNIFYLHRFPLLSKCSTLQKLAATMAGNDDGITRIAEFPGGIESFKLCAKFCYGISITLNARNVLGVRCGAEYLGMTESMEKGNLIFKLEVFLSSSVLKSWKDSIVSLGTTRALLPWSQDLKLISRCIDAIASKTSVDPSMVEWKFKYTRKCADAEQNGEFRQGDGYAENSHCWNGALQLNGGGRNHHKHGGVPSDWWVEDVCSLDMDFFYKTMMAIKTKGRMCNRLIGEALEVYATKWWLLEEEEEQYHYSDHDHRHKALMETLIKLLPPEKGCCSCRFLLQLLKSASLLLLDDADDDSSSSSFKMDLVRKIALQLHEASIHDILLLTCPPSSSSSSSSTGAAANAHLYDVDLVQLILQQFLLLERIPQHKQCPHPHSPPTSSNTSSALSRSTQPSLDNNSESKELDESGAVVVEEQPNAKLLKVAKLVDEYLAEIAKDPNLALSKFVSLAETVPDMARPLHDALYGAIDIYLKEHPELTKHEKKRLCGLMDCKKLSIDASKHAAQNERLPLRLVVQVLFFEQVRASATAGSLFLNEPSPGNTTCKELPFPAEAESFSHGHGNPDDHLNANGSDEWGSVHNGSSSKCDPKSETGNNIQPQISMQKKAASSQPSPLQRNDDSNTQTHVEATQSTRPSKTNNLISSSKRIIRRILSVRQSSSERSRGSDMSRSPGSSTSSAAPPKREKSSTEPRETKVRRGRHSIS